MTDPRQVRGNGAGYPVVEVFQSVQFEGGRTGTLNVFLRFAGCNLNCAFCDTDFSKYTWMTIPQIRQMVKDVGGGCRNLVLTGGEPLVHDLWPLLATLKSDGWYIAMETNGIGIHAYDADTHLRPFFKLVDWMTVSPKTVMIGHAHIFRASELKYVIPDHKKLLPMRFCGRMAPQIYLQPEWDNPEALNACLEMMRQHPDLRLSIQTHKFLDLR